MKGFDVLKVKSAVKAHNKFDLSRTHLTTAEFGQIIPLFVEETVPGDKFTINAEYFSRMAPLAVPTYGKFSFKTVSAFVPYHQIAWDSDAWLAGKVTWEGNTPHHRYLSVEALDLFIRSYCTSGGTAVNSQYTYVDASGTITYRVFTAKGKYFMKVLNALGYACPQGVDLQTTSVWYTTVRTTKLSAYPLLAFGKLYNDYMSQSQRFNTSALSSFLQCVKYGKAVTGFVPASGALNQIGIDTILENIFLCYENDYFTSAWQNPNTPLGSTPENIDAGAVPGGYAGVVEGDLHNNYNNLPVMTTPSPDHVNISQRALDFLRSFDDWVRRNNYSGSRAVQQVYSRFGVKTDDYKSHYANVLSTDVMPVHVGDIMSTADTSTAVLGEYAGKGIMSGNKTVHVEVSDYGLILILGYFTVRPMNSFGYDRRVLRSEPLDYYNPEFDGIGADAISVGEFFTKPTVVGDTAQDNSVYGFTERYNAYRYGRDVISGDFRDGTAAGIMNAWHTGRDMSAIRTAGNLVAQSSSVNTLPQVNSEYNRIFSTIGLATVDHFYLTADFDVSAVRPMMNLNQVPRLGEGDTVVPRNGNTIS